MLLLLYIYIRLRTIQHFNYVPLFFLIFTNINLVLPLKILHEFFTYVCTIFSLLFLIVYFLLLRSIFSVVVSLYRCSVCKACVLRPACFTLPALPQPPTPIPNPSTPPPLTASKSSCRCMWCWMNLTLWIAFSSSKGYFFLTATSLILSSSPTMDGSPLYPGPPRAPSSPLNLRQTEHTGQGSDEVINTNNKNTSRTVKERASKVVSVYFENLFGMLR